MTSAPGTTGAPRRPGNLARTLVTLLLAVFVVGGVVTAPDPQVDRAVTIGRQIRCPVCNGESIADSSASLAEGMMDLVRKKIDEGLSDDQVIEAVLTGYGSDAQRLDPRFSARTAVLWLLPIAVLIGGAAVALAKRRPDQVSS